MTMGGHRKPLGGRGFAWLTGGRGGGGGGRREDTYFGCSVPVCVGPSPPPPHPPLFTQQCLQAAIGPGDSGAWPAECGQHVSLPLLHHVALVEGQLLRTHYVELGQSRLHDAVVPLQQGLHARDLQRSGRQAGRQHGASRPAASRQGLHARDLQPGASRQHST